MFVALAVWAAIDTKVTKIVSRLLSFAAVPVEFEEVVCYMVIHDRRAWQDP